MDINIINNWSIAIRACEIKNFYRIFGIEKNYQGSDKEYWAVMNLLTHKNYTLLDLATMKDIYYNSIKQEVKFESGTKTTILNLIDLCRFYIKNNQKGNITLRYLLYTCNNKIIKDQLGDKSCFKLSNLYLNFGCIPFEEMPYASSLIRHNPSRYSLLEDGG